jgi:hypothetical protein
MTLHTTDAVTLVLHTGSGFTKRLIVRSSATHAAIDLAGASAHLDIKQYPDDETPLFSFSSEPGADGLLTLNAVPGAIDFDASDEATAAITFTGPLLQAVFDCQLTLPDLYPQWLFGGTARIIKGITQPPQETP